MSENPNKREREERADKVQEALTCSGYNMLVRKLILHQKKQFTPNCHEDGAQLEDKDGRRFCLMHARTENKAREFGEAIKKKIDDGDYNFAGYWFPSPYDFTGKTFHKGREVDFRVTTFNDSADFSQTKFLDEVYFDDARFNERANFERAVFLSHAYFSKVKFTNSQVSFARAYFTSDSYFNNASFSEHVFFNGAFFGQNAIFADTIFDKQVFFNKALFDNDIVFSGAYFGDTVSFLSTRMKKVFFANTHFVKSVNFDFTEITDDGDFDNVKIGDRFRFNGNYMRNCSFDSLEIENPEKVSFRNVLLRPHWFVNVDIKKIQMFNVTWGDASTSINEELNALREKRANENPYFLLRNIYTQIAVNADENHLYAEAMKYRYLSLETHRKAIYFSRYAPLTLHWWYWASSGYGERAARAAVMLFLVWLIPFFFYASPAAIFADEPSNFAMVGKLITQIRLGSAAQIDPFPPRAGNGLPLQDAAFYSLNTMAFQKPEPKPANDSWLTRLVVTLQTILGPVQAALLVLAIRRKFMR